MKKRFRQHEQAAEKAEHRLAFLGLSLKSVLRGTRKALLPFS
jgi:hypothetical protein